MAAQKIGYPNKQSGSLWTSSNANEVKDVVNGHADALDSLSTTVTNTRTEVNGMREMLESHDENMGNMGKFIQSTDEEIAAMNTAQTWEEGTFYYTVED